MMALCIIDAHVLRMLRWGGLFVTMPAENLPQTPYWFENETFLIIMYANATLLFFIVFGFKKQFSFFNDRLRSFQ